MQTLNCSSGPLHTYLWDAYWAHFYAMQSGWHYSLCNVAPSPSIQWSRAVFSMNSDASHLHSSKENYKKLCNTKVNEIVTAFIPHSSNLSSKRNSYSFQSQVSRQKNTLLTLMRAQTSSYRMEQDHLRSRYIANSVKEQKMSRWVVFKRKFLGP
jgi:hypothetical protein